MDSWVNVKKMFTFYYTRANGQLKDYLPTPQNKESGGGGLGMRRKGQKKTICTRAKYRYKPY